MSNAAITYPSIDFTEVDLETSPVSNLINQTFYSPITISPSVTLFSEQGISIIESSFNIEKETEFKESQELKKSQLFNQLDYIESLGREWNSDGINGPNEFSINYSKSLVEDFLMNDFMPLRVTQSIEEGVSFVFKHKDKFLYLEVYNDEEIGLIIEDFKMKRVLKNIELTSKNHVLSEISDFYKYDDIS